ncbi:MAG: hypothetical protein ABS46_09590 [Cytophagaceae bacterium SCN 52-12]|nr:MAG: hypothetical protein ABS46_09590 [Cytophagaceae bacterium SCN 52-12]
MKKLFFWKSWTAAERISALAVLILLAAALLYLLAWSGIFSGTGRVKWDIISLVHDMAVPVNRLKLGDFEFVIPAPSVYITEQYAAPLMLPDAAAGLFFLVVALAGLSVVLAALTTLSRFWFLGGLAVLVPLLVFSRTEMLVFPGLPERTLLLLALVLYGGTGYYLQAFRQDVGIASRIALFTAISAMLALVTVTVCSGPEPAYTFLVYSLPLWLIPAVIFMLVSATEILYGIVWLTTSKSAHMGGRSLLNFSVIGGLYLLVLVFAYVSNTRMADWGLALVPVWLLGACSGLIGLTGFRLRCESTEGHLPFRESGFWLYSGLFLITAGVTGMAVAAGNDPLLEVLEDSVINSQLGMGLAFVFYIIANFLPLLRKGMQVHKVLYKPMNFSLTRTRIIGVALVAGLFSMQNLFPVRQGIAAYFNGLGDLHTLTSQYTLAEQYYKMSLQQEFQNHKGNYALASLARIQGDNNAAIYYFRQATLKKPSPQAYIGLSNLLAQEDLYFEAMFSLREGQRAFPRSGPVLNNIGLLYARTNLSDSAYYFLSSAEKLADDGVASVNILGVLSGVLGPEALDSLAGRSRSAGNLSWNANRLLVGNLAGKNPAEKSRNDALRPDSLLSAAGFAYWMNYTYNQAANDSTLARKIRQIASKNDLMAGDLLLASAHADFYGGNKTKALETLLALAGNDGKDSGLYHKILGHWFLQTGLYDKAIEQFSEVSEPDAVIGHAIAQSLSGNPVSGIIVLERLKESGTDSLEIARLQNAVTSLVPPRSAADSLLAAARKGGTEEAFRAALRYNPYDPALVAGVAAYLGQQKAGVPKAYAVVVDALRFNETSPLLWGEYALLSLDMGLSDQAEEARENVRKFADDAGYHDFSTRYHAKWSLKQKEKEDFR